MTDELRESFLKAADEILALVREQSFSNHFIFGTGRPVPLRVTDRSGRLVQAVTRATTRGDRAVVNFTAEGAEIMGRIDRGEYPHALLIHEGGIKAVTNPMRRFFWAKFYQTKGSEENIMWSKLRYQTSVTYQPRPYLMNAVREVAEQIPEVLRRHTLEGLMIEVQKIITGAKGATVK